MEIYVKPWSRFGRRLAAQKAKERRKRRAKMARVQKIYSLYRRTLSLAETGRKLGFTREWIRNLLEYGHRTKAIAYFGAENKLLIKLFKKIDRAELARDIAAPLPQAEICSKYGIPAVLCEKLARHLAAGRSLDEV